MTLGLGALPAAAENGAVPSDAALAAAEAKEEAQVPTVLPEGKKGTLLFVPLDTRPVCREYTVRTMEDAGWQIIVPPEELLSGADGVGDPDSLLEWVEENAGRAIAVVASSDALIYGGLVDSRTHHYDEAVLRSRAERVLNLKKASGGADVYLFTTVMRSPRASSAPAEPEYYAQWGKDLFRQGELLDKQELGKAKKKEKKELEALSEKIPLDIRLDYYSRRQVNIRTTELLLHGMESDSFNYLLIGRDDTAPLSQAHREARQMETLVRNLPDEKIRFFAGADQLGLVLLNQAACRLTHQIPLVYGFYAPGKGGDTIPSYEDEKISSSVRNHIFAAGGYPVKKVEKADYIIAVNTPENGVTLEAGNAKNDGTLSRAGKKFVDRVEKYVADGKKVAVADSAYGNGADNALVKELFARDLAYKIQSYAGWNTSGNSVGYAVAQGILADKMDKAAQKDAISRRYLDDWAYQANVRTQVYQTLIWPNSMPGSGLEGEDLKKAEDAVSDGIKDFARPYMGETVDAYAYSLPWHRMFEVDVKDAAQAAKEAAEAKKAETAAAKDAADAKAEAGTIDAK